MPKELPPLTPDEIESLMRSQSRKRPVIYTARFSNSKFSVTAELSVCVWSDADPNDVQALLDRSLDYPESWKFEHISKRKV